MWQGRELGFQLHTQFLMAAVGEPLTRARVEVLLS